MRIAELSQRSGVPIPTIKFYLRERILPRGKRVADNQAEYTEDHVQRLRLIRALVEVGSLSLTSVRKVLDSIDDERVALLDVLRIAHFALGPAPGDGEPTSDLGAAMADVDKFLADLGWEVDPDAPGRRALGQTLVTLRRLGQEIDVKDFEPYARAADRIAEREVASIDAGEPRGTVVEAIVLGTVAFEAALTALRRLAQERHAAKRFAPRTVRRPRETRKAARS
jgi:DNA-binding transcriptional MerR regulator